MIRGVANVWMPVDDIERAVDFYQNVLGLRLVNRRGCGPRSTPMVCGSASALGNPKGRVPRAVRS